MKICKNWLLLSCNVDRLLDATLSIKATKLGDSMLVTGGVKEEEKKRV